jgi:hypothetical protein
MFRSLFRFLRPPAARMSLQQRCHLVLEALEDRLTLSGGSLVVASFDTNSVLRYSGDNGAFIDTMIPKASGGLSQPFAVLFGPYDHNLYVSSGIEGGPGHDKAILRYDGATGAFLDTFVDDTHLTSPRGIIFGPDGNLYVADGDGPGRIVRYNGVSGTFMDEFVSITNNGGLAHPQGLVFGPDGRNDGKLDLYVSGAIDSENVFRYDGTTGAFLGKYVADGSVHRPGGLTFGPDGNLYVPDFGTGIVYRFQGPSGTSPGAPMPSAGNGGAVFISAGSGGLRSPLSLLFGPDGNGDGRQDLYVANVKLGGIAKGNAHTSTVKRFDSVTGAFIDTFVAANSGGLDDPNFLAFSETDPVTLAYTGDHLMAASNLSSPTNATVAVGQGVGAVLDGESRTCISDVIRYEGKKYQPTRFTFTVTLSAAYDQPVTVSYQTVNGTATTKDNDYVAKSGTLTFAPGETTKTITIVVNGDSKKEADETFYLDLFGNSSNSWFTKKRGLGTILNDD